MSDRTETPALYAAIKEALSVFKERNDLRERVAMLESDLDLSYAAYDKLKAELDEARKGLGWLNSPQATGRNRPNRPKLTSREVRDIRELRRSGWTHQAIADAYDVNRSTVYRTINGDYHAKGMSDAPPLQV